MLGFFYCRKKCSWLLEFLLDFLSDGIFTTLLFKVQKLTTTKSISLSYAFVKKINASDSTI